MNFKKYFLLSEDFKLVCLKYRLFTMNSVLMAGEIR